MTLSNVLMASLMGVMSLSGAVAKRDLTQHSVCDHNPDHSSCKEESIAVCTAVAWGYSEETNKDQSVQAAADAHAYICGGGGSADAHAIATASARAFARAVAQASVSGYVEGDASCWLHAHASAQTEASVWLESYAEAFATSADCKHCDAYAGAWAYVREEVFLSAQASAKASLDLYSNGGNIAAHVYNYAEEIEEKIVTAYAEALAGAANYYDTNSCWAYADANGCIYPDGPCAGCTASAVSDTYIEEIDAIATAVAKASADACGSVVVSFASASAWAKAIAEALAIATAQTFVSCQSDDGGYACGDAGAYATDTAKAVAKAFATAWAGAISCGPDCYVNVDSAASAIGEVSATAVAAAYSSLCADPGSGYWSVHDFQQHIEENHLAAIAEACALALALDTGSGGFCLAATSASAYTH